jgi:signal transduction histidine kinase
MIRRPFQKSISSLIARGCDAAGMACRLLVLMTLFLTVNLLQSAPAVEDKNDSSRYHMAKVPPGATNGLGDWIWASNTFDRQTCRLWREFDIPAGAKVTSARMRMTVDNAYQFYLDGCELGQGADWGGLTEYDLTLLLPPGHHVLAVNGFNDFFEAGLIMDLAIELSDGRTLDIKSDESWRIVPNDKLDWEKLKHPQDDWPSAKAITGTNRAIQWNDGHWPFDYVSVPRFYPVVIPFWQTGWFHLLLAFVCGLIFLACIALLMQVALQSKERQLLNLERARIARDIHDDVGTRLTKLVLQGEVAQSFQPENYEARQQLDIICDGLRGVLGAMDEMLWAVNPRHDTVENFISYICDYAQTFLQNTKIQSVLEVESGIPPLNFDLPLRRSLLLAVKEAINNAAKHSAASQIFLKIHRNGSKLVVIVEDNGRGFDLNQTRRDRNGLTNLFQRMSEAGGECHIMTRPGKGCRVEFSITLTRYATRHWFLGRTRQPEPKFPFVELGAAPPSDAKANQLIS